MTQLPETAFDPRKIFLHLEDGGACIPLSVTPTFWPDLIEADQKGTFGRGWLVTYNAMDGAADHWENHPHGDEIFHLLRGRLEVLLEDGSGERIVELTPGHSCIIPSGVWHTVRATQPSEFIGITYGHGTQSRPISQVA